MKSRQTEYLPRGTFPPSASHPHVPTSTLPFHHTYSAMNDHRVGSEDPFLQTYQPSELRIASEFFATWLPFLSKDLCRHCTQILSDRIRSIDPGTQIYFNGKIQKQGRVFSEGKFWLFFFFLIGFWAVVTLFFHDSPTPRVCFDF